MACLTIFALAQPKADNKTILASFEKNINDVLLEAQNYANRRNEIAHGRVMRLKEEGTGADGGHYLLPSFFNPKKFSLDSKVTYMYVAADILFYANRFDILGQKLFNWYRLLKGAPR